MKRIVLMDDKNRVVKDVNKATRSIETEYDDKTQKLVYERRFILRDKKTSMQH